MTPTYIIIDYILKNKSDQYSEFHSSFMWYSVELRNYYALYTTTREISAIWLAESRCISA